jgi:hypothetical protein
MHAFSHIYSDHYNENGLHYTDKAKLEIYRQSFPLGSCLDSENLYFLNTRYIPQSLLPHDIEVLNHEYSPKAKNITFELNNLTKHFGYELVNNGIITLANIGNTKIDTSNIKNYSIDLRPEHISNITSSYGTNYSFLLSYRTKISQIKLDQMGSITLSDSFRTNITLSPGCYNINLHSNFYQSDMIINRENETCANELPKCIALI